jgi:hypothetical protein
MPAGYIMEKVDGKWKLQHRLVMEQYLGRTLVEGENVHHKDGNRANNEVDNLELWGTPQPSGIRLIDAARAIFYQLSEDEQTQLLEELLA